MLFRSQRQFNDAEVAPQTHTDAGDSAPETFSLDGISVYKLDQFDPDDYAHDVTIPLLDDDGSPLSAQIIIDVINDHWIYKEEVLTLIPLSTVPFVELDHIRQIECDLIDCYDLPLTWFNIPPDYVLNLAVDAYSGKPILHGLSEDYSYTFGEFVSLSTLLGIYATQGKTRRNHVSVLPEWLFRPDPRLVSYKLPHILQWLTHHDHDKLVHFFLSLSASLHFDWKRIFQDYRVVQLLKYGWKPSLVPLSHVNHETVRSITLCDHSVKVIYVAELCNKMNITSTHGLLDAAIEIPGMKALGPLLDAVQSLVNGKISETINDIQLSINVLMVLMVTVGSGFLFSHSQYFMPFLLSVFGFFSLSQSSFAKTVKEAYERWVDKFRVQTQGKLEFLPIGELLITLQGILFGHEISSKYLYSDLAQFSRNSSSIIIFIEKVWKYGVAIYEQITNSSELPEPATPRVHAAVLRCNKITAQFNKDPNGASRSVAWVTGIRHCLGEMSVMYGTYIGTSPNAVAMRNYIKPYLDELRRVCKFAEEKGALGILTYHRRPATIFIQGESGVGKSWMCDLLANAHFKTYHSDRFASHNEIVYRRTTSQYWEGYAGDPVIYFDDFGSLVDAVSTPNPNFIDLLNLVSDAPVPLDMAFAKGSTFSNAELILGSYNKWQKAASMSNADALHRRVDLHVTMGFAKPDTEEDLKHFNLGTSKFESVSTPFYYPKETCPLPIRVKYMRFYRRDETGVAKNNWLTFQEFMITANRVVATRMNAKPPASSGWSLDALAQAGIYTHGLNDIACGVYSFVNGAMDRITTNLFPLPYAEKLEPEEHDQLLAEACKTRARFRALLKCCMIVGSALAILAVGHLITTSFSTCEGCTQGGKAGSGSGLSGGGTRNKRQTVNKHPSFDRVVKYNGSSHGYLDSDAPRSQGYEDLPGADFNVNECISDECLDIYKRNVFGVVYPKQNGVPVVQASCMGIGDQLLLFNAHIWSRLPNHFTLIRWTLEDRDKDIVILKEDCVATSIRRKDGGYSDLMLVHCPGVGCCRRIVSHFLNDAEVSQFSPQGVVVMPLRNSEIGEVKRDFLFSSYGMVAPRVSVMDDNLGELRITQVLTLAGVTRAGDCGSPALADIGRPGAHLTGIVVAGDSNRVSYVTMVSRESLLSGITAMQKEHPRVCWFKPTTQGAPTASWELDDELTQLFTYEGKCDLFDNVPFPSKPSVLKPSIIAPYLKKEGILPSRFPAQLRNSKDPVTKEFICPRINAFQKLKKPRETISGDTQIDVATVLDHVIPKLLPCNADRRVLTEKEAILGVPDSSLHSIDLQNSPGFPYCAEKIYAKSDLLKIDHKNSTYEFLQDGRVKRDIDDFFEGVESGEYSKFIFADRLKDELRAPAKVARPRMFSMSSLPFLILFRRYFGSALMTIRDGKIVNGVCVGTNPYSADWNAIYDKLVGVCGSGCANFIAGDFSDYDASLNSIFTHKIFSKIIAWYDDPDNEHIRWILANCVIYSAHELAGEMYIWHGSNPSGCPITTELNSIYNLVAVIYCFLRRFRRLPSSADLAVVVYGDDNLISVNDDIKNQMTPSDWLKGMEALGMKYTCADKSGPPKYQNIYEVEFLKRGFVPSEDRVLSPLSKTTLIDMVLYNRGVLKNTGELIQRCSESVNEMAQHGEHEFYNWSRKIGHLLRRCNLPAPLACDERHKDVLANLANRSSDFSHF